MAETPKKPFFNADAAEEYFTSLCIYYMDSRNQMFKKDNEGRNSENFYYSAEYQKLLGKEMAIREVLDYFSKFDLGSAADVVEVVRCRDCKYSYDDLSGLYCAHGICVDCLVYPEYYCANGEKREADDGGVH